MRGDKLLENTMRIGALTLIIILCYKIIQPIMLIAVWGAIIAIAVNPVYNRLLKSKFLRGKKVYVVMVMALGAIGVITLPISLLIGSIIESTGHVITIIESGKFQEIGMELGAVKLPFVNENIASYWQMASENLSLIGQKLIPVINGYLPKVLSFVGGLGSVVAQTILAILIAGVFLIYRESIVPLLEKSSKALLKGYIDDFMGIAGSTIRSVVNGVIGIGVIQGIASGIGLFLVGAPGAGVLTLLATFLAIIQLTPLIVMIPMAIYVFMYKSTIALVLYLLWCGVITFGDTFLRPFLMGKGLEIPSIVIIIGALCGMIKWGVTGLFIGAVVLALGYKILQAVIDEEIGDVVDESKDIRSNDV